MRQLLCKRNLGGLLLAALTAGALVVPAVSAQSASAQAKKPVHKRSSGAHTSSATQAKSSSANKAAGPPTAKSSGAKSSHTVASKKSSRKKTKKVKGQAAPTTDRITEIQEALAKKGALTSAPTGQWDDSTVDAMKKFQASNGLNPSGKLDALTLQKLGLGSETAGLAAPTPPPNSANRLRNLSSLPPETNNEKP